MTSHIKKHQEHLGTMTYPVQQKKAPETDRIVRDICKLSSGQLLKVLDKIKTRCMENGGWGTTTLVSAQGR